METAVKKPKCWFRDVDDTFVVWSHGLGELPETPQLCKLKNSVYYGIGEGRAVAIFGCLGNQRTEWKTICIQKTDTH